MLANQYKILSMIDPANKDSYLRAHDAVESGYEIAIQGLFDPISDGLDEEDCLLVIRSMDMYSAMQRSIEKLPQSSGISKNDVMFDGFDGNNETMFMAYACFLVEKEHRFTDLKPEDNDFNSHCQMVPAYFSMLRVWETMGRRYNLSADEIRAILEARWADS